MAALEHSPGAPCNGGFYFVRAARLIVPAVALDRGGNVGERYAGRALRVLCAVHSARLLARLGVVTLKRSTAQRGRHGGGPMHCGGAVTAGSSRRGS